MESNKFISVSYKLYDITDGKSDLIEQTRRAPIHLR